MWTLKIPTLTEEENLWGPATHRYLAYGKEIPTKPTPKSDVLGQFQAHNGNIFTPASANAKKKRRRRERRGQISSSVDKRVLTMSATRCTEAAASRASAARSGESSGEGRNAADRRWTSSARSSDGSDSEVFCLHTIRKLVSYWSLVSYDLGPDISGRRKQ